MKQNQINKSIVIAIVVGLVGPFILTGVLSALGMAPQYVVDGELKGLTSILGSGSGITIFLISAVVFAVAAVIPAFMIAGDSESAADYEDDAGLNGDDDRETGEVKWFNPNKGFGFITRNNGEEIFVHFRSIRGRGHRSLRQGQSVRFRTVEGDKGLQAEDVSPLRN
ncbi:cold-shock protein [Hahella sp. CCB-MM4]|uniref:cold-shock protein n=1 Tax=Hahella sp. (strain CCB-MM4) TaxID=1926491 RepID=UPI000B9B33D7|nr:cold shock domain-containing protein [Hahella sp. CCB-MM4]OZG70492.1 cold-shock protein [Hahella sp. CCB-MM4]